MISSNILIPSEATESCSSGTLDLHVANTKKAEEGSESGIEKKKS